MDNKLSKGFTGVEVNGARFSNIQEMLIYMNKQRDQLTEAKEIIRELISWQILTQYWEVKAKAEAFLKE